MGSWEEEPTPLPGSVSSCRPVVSYSSRVAQQTPQSSSSLSGRSLFRRRSRCRGRRRVMFILLLRTSGSGRRLFLRISEERPHGGDDEKETEERFLGKKKSEETGGRGGGKDKDSLERMGQTEDRGRRVLRTPPCTCRDRADRTRLILLLS